MKLKINNNMKITNFFKFFSEGDIKFYKERMEILSADLRAVTLYKRLCDLQNKARNYVSLFY